MRSLRWDLESRDVEAVIVIVVVVGPAHRLSAPWVGVAGWLLRPPHRKTLPEPRGTPAPSDAGGARHPPSPRPVGMQPRQGIARGGGVSPLAARGEGTLVAKPQDKRSAGYARRRWGPVPSASCSGGRGRRRRRREARRAIESCEDDPLAGQCESPLARVALHLCQRQRQRRVSHRGPCHREGVQEMPQLPWGQGHGDGAMAGQVVGQSGLVRD